MAWSLAAVPLLVWGISHLPQEPWWDEIVSLKTFTLADLRTTVSDYAFPHGNLHTFYNILENLYARLLGLRDPAAAIEKIHWLRLPQLALALATTAIVFLTGRRFFGRAAGFVAAAVLATTIPFLNFALQLRGYNLSALLAAAMLYSVWSYGQAPRAWRAARLAVLCLLLLYTMPSNLYFLLSVAVIALVKWIAWARGESPGTSRRAWVARLLRHPDAGVLAALIVGAVLFLGAYAPMLDELLSSRFVRDRADPRTLALSALLPEVLRDFTAFRYALLIPFAVGTARILLRFKRERAGDPPAGGLETRGETSRWLELWALLLLPFGIACAQGSAPFARTFVLLAPIWSLLVAAGVAAAAEAIRVRPRGRLAWGAMLLIYCAATLFLGHRHIENRLAANIHDGIRAQGLLYNYYLSERFRPADKMRLLAEAVSADPAPVVVAQEVDRVALDHYLRKYGLSYACTVKTEELAGQGPHAYICLFLLSRKGEEPVGRRITMTAEGDLSEECRDFSLLYSYLVRSGLIRGERFYLVTSFPGKIESIRKDCGHDFGLRRLDDRSDYTSIFAVSRPQSSMPGEEAGHSSL